MNVSVQNSRVRLRLLELLVGCALVCEARAGTPMSADQAVALAMKQNPEIAIARKQLEAARGGVVEARSGYLPSVVASGLYRKRERQESSRLRTDDYNASARVVQNIYTGGAVGAQMSIARLIEEKRALELQVMEDRVAMDVRVAFYDVLLNRAKRGVREQSVHVLEDELKAQRERLAAGLVGELNVHRAEVALANEEPELVDAETRLQNSRLQLATLLGIESPPGYAASAVDPSGELRYRGYHPDLKECLAHADAERPEIKAREIDVAIEEAQLRLDASETKPHVDVFSGYEMYSELDPDVGPEFNHGYVVGLNANWHVFDGFATRGRMQATRARRDAAKLALEAARASVVTDVRSAFLDLDQAQRTLEAETKSVVDADQSLEIAKANLAAGLGTQLDVLQAANDVTRTRTTRLSAIYLHNVALARLARATARGPEALGFGRTAERKADEGASRQVFDLAKPPATIANEGR
ncbi:MAG: TolC family protein [Chthoniobacterales bacterium]